MKDLFHPSSVVVIGVSTVWSNLGKEIAKNLFEFGFSGIIRLVGPKGGNFFGHRIHRSVDEIDEQIDLAVILTPAATVPGILNNAVKREFGE